MNILKKLKQKFCKHAEVSVVRDRLDRDITFHRDLTLQCDKCSKMFYFRRWGFIPDSPTMTHFLDREINYKIPDEWKRRYYGVMIGSMPTINFCVAKASLEVIGDE